MEIDAYVFLLYNTACTQSRKKRGFFVDFVIQLIGFIGLGLSIAAFQFKKHRSIVLCKMASELVFALQYIFLGAWTAAILDGISVVRNLLYTNFVKRGRSTTPVIIGFGIFVVVVGIMTYVGPISLLPIGAKLLTTISYGMKNEKLLRFITLPSCIMWSIYNLYVGSLGGALGDTLAMTSLLIAIYKFDIRKK